MKKLKSKTLLKMLLGLLLIGQVSISEAVDLSKVDGIVLSDTLDFPTFTSDISSVDVFLGISGEDKGRSGDVVGNGRIWSNPDFNLDDLFLSPEDRLKRNSDFDNYLDLLGIDPTQARSGDVVGNGGGFYESQAYFYYHNLAKHIISSFEQTYVDFTEGEKVVLQRILDHTPIFGEEGKLIFLSQQGHPTFFFDEDVDPAPRVAKTGFDHTYPIFINRDMIYEKTERHSTFWIGVLVHELGHQVGVENHTFLEELGGKVALVARLDKDEISYTFDENNILQVIVYNHKFLHGTADITVNFRDLRSSTSSLKPVDLVSVCGILDFGGMVLKNLHWEDKPEMRNNVHGEYMQMVAKSWANVKCFDRSTGVFFDRSRDAKVIIQVFRGRLDVNLHLN